MENKKCVKCDLEQPTTNFYVQKGMSSGFSNICRSCNSKLSKERREKLKLDPEWVEKQRNRSRVNYFNKYRSEKGFLRYKFNRMKNRSLEKGFDLPMFTFEDFVKWAYDNNFKNLFDNWVYNNYLTELSPSVDRINPNIGYVFENMRLINWSENNKYNYYVQKNKAINKRNMSVKLNKLWGNNKFVKLSVHSKYLFVYLTSHNTINTVGVLSVPLNLISYETGLTIDELRESTKELVDSNYIYVVKAENDIYWIIPSHFSTVGNSDSTIEKIKSDLKSLPDKVVNFLDSIGINSSKKRKKFDKPTPDEVEQYGISMGYKVDGQAFCDFYQNNPKSDEHLWYDSRGKLVLDWKAKLRKVWCKDDMKLKMFKDAPKGFEYFHLKNASGLLFPDGWKDGKPFSKDFIANKELKKEYEKRKANS